jgi:uncharacterized membrane protein YkgB
VSDNCLRKINFSIKFNKIHRISTIILILSLLQSTIAGEKQENVTEEDLSYLEDLGAKMWSKENQIQLACVIFGIIVLILLIMCLINERARRVSHIALWE